MKKQQIKGFTLVELIIVITILAILATVAFVFFKGYVSNARDSSRLADVSNIEKALSLNVIQSGKVPTPDNSIPIKSEGNTIGNQGELGKTTSQILKISGNLKDPLTGDSYTYFSNNSSSNGQVVAFLEGGNETKTYKDKQLVYSGDPLGLILDTDNNPINKNTTILSQGYFDTLTGAYATGDIKVVFNSTPYTYKPFIVGGQLLQMSKGKSFLSPTKCPDNFIPVPGNKDLGQPGFCAGKYEASWATVTGSNLVTISGAIPANNFDITLYPTTLCQGNGAGYHNMTLMERTAIARDIEKQSKNWSSGIVGSGHIFTGNSGDNSTGFNTGVLLKAGPSGNTTQDNLRQLSLSNGENIWDFVGNLSEVVSPINYADGSNEYIKYLSGYSLYLPSYVVSGITINTYVNWSNISDNSFKDLFGPKTSLSSSAGLGMVYEYSPQTNTRYYLLGGKYNSSSGQSGLYTILKYFLFSSPQAGIRCSYTP